MSRIEGAEELRALLIRTKLVMDLSWYFLYEAADTVLRMQNCKLELQGLLLNMLPDFYLGEHHLSKLEQLFQHQPIPREWLYLTVPFEALCACNDDQLEYIRSYLRNGFRLVLDGYRPDEIWTPERVLDLGFTYLRMAPDLLLLQETGNALYGIRQMGFSLLGGGADSPELLTWLLEHGALCASGTMTGPLVEDDDLVLDTLAREEFGPTPPKMPEPPEPDSEDPAGAPANAPAGAPARAAESAEEDDLDLAEEDDLDPLAEEDDLGKA